MMRRGKSSDRLAAVTISCTYCAFSGRFCLLSFHLLIICMAGHAS